ncbi:MAG: CRISPR-associated endoribonuclease Cas6 [Candidatus Methanomethylicia archaeon]
MSDKSIISLKFNIEINEKFKFQRYSGFTIQNFFFKTFKDINSKIAEKLHNESTIKPYSVSTLMMDEKPVYYGGDPGYYNFKINILDNEIINLTSIIQNIFNNNRIDLDNIIFHLDGIEVKSIDYKQLLNSEINNTFTLRFLTPTCFKGEIIYPKRVKGRGKESVYEVRRKKKAAYQPIPNPTSMMRNLLRIWTRSCEMPNRSEIENAIDNDQIRIYEYKDGIRTVWASEGSRKNQQGFIGEVTFEIEEEIINSIGRNIAALIKMGEYSGTGIMRTAGLGQYKIVDGVK